MAARCLHEDTFMNKISLMLLLSAAIAGYGCASGGADQSAPQTQAAPPAAGESGESDEAGDAHREEVLQHIADSLDSLKSSCAAHDARACTFVATYYEHRAGSHEEALKYYTQACGGNDGVGCGALADLYYRGLGTLQSRSRAFRLYARSCRLNVGEACSNAAEMLEKGEGTRADPSRALNYYDRACAFGVKTACTRSQELIGGVLNQP